MDYLAVSIGVKTRVDEIEIWAIEGAQVVTIERTQIDLESNLEGWLVAHPSMLQPNLKLIGRQTPVGDGNLDLLGIDGEGRLVVFELKRGTLSRDAVAQVIDYGSALEAMSEIELAALIAESSGKFGIEKIEDFVEWYREGFGGSLDSLRPLRMYLVGLGTEDATRRMVDYLAEHGVDISLLTFYGFEFSGKTLLAKQVQVAARDEVSPGRSREELWRSLDSLARDLGVDDLVAAARQLFDASWDEVIQGKYSNPYPEPRKTGITFYLNKPTEAGGYSSSAFSSIEIDKGQNSVKVRYYPWAIDLCKERFDQLDAQDMPYETRTPPNAQVTDRVKEEILFPFHSVSEWEARRDKLAELTRAVYAAYRVLWESQ
jgi:hypothetical protein